MLAEDGMPIPYCPMGKTHKFVMSFSMRSKPSGEIDWVDVPGEILG
jgi:hypothetical protein